MAHTETQIALEAMVAMVANSYGRNNSYASYDSYSTLVDQVGASLGLYSSYRGGRGGHPSMVPQYTKDCLIFNH